MKYAWLIGGGTAVVVLLTAAFVGVAYLRRPVRTVAVIGFRPVFIGADARKYPNGLPFAASDVIDKAITDQVFASNHLGTYCDAGAFRSGFFVNATSTGLVILDAEYKARLEDPKLTLQGTHEEAGRSVRRIQATTPCAPDPRCTRSRARSIFLASARTLGSMPRSGWRTRSSSRHSCWASVACSTIDSGPGS